MVFKGIGMIFSPTPLAVLLIVLLSFQINNIRLCFKDNLLILYNIKLQKQFDVQRFQVVSVRLATCILSNAAFSKKK